jgi:branched-chain amino acid aminotransferase
MAQSSAGHRQIWIDGELVPWEKATVHVLSHSLQRGSLIFDYMSVYQTPRGPAVFRMPEHVARLLHSAELVGLPLALGAAEIEAAILATVRANPGATAVKVSAYLPSIEVDVVPLDPHVAVAIAAYDPQADINAGKPSPPHRPQTLKIWIEKAVKNRREDIVPPQAKVSGNYTSPMQAKWNARRAGYDEILLVDEDGFVAEGPTTNVFLVDAEGVLATPPEEKVLLGVTRSSILALAKAEGLRAEERRIRPEALALADEVFLTGTTAGVWPVESVDGEKIAGGAPGPVSARLATRFRAVTHGEDAAFAHWLTPVDQS